MRVWLLSLLCVCSATAAAAEPAELAEDLESAAVHLIRRAAADLSALQAYTERPGRSASDQEIARLAMQRQYPDGVRVVGVSNAAPRAASVPRFTLAWTEEDGGNIRMRAEGFDSLLVIPPLVFGQALVDAGGLTWPHGSWIFCRGKVLFPDRPCPGADRLLARMAKPEGLWKDLQDPAGFPVVYAWHRFNIGELDFDVVTSQALLPAGSADPTPVVLEPRVLRRPDVARLPAPESAKPLTQTPPAAPPPAEPEPGAKPAAVPAVPVPAVQPVVATTGGLQALWSGAYLVKGGIEARSVRGEVRVDGETFELNLDWDGAPQRIRGRIVDGVLRAEGDWGRLEARHAPAQNAIQGDATLSDGSVRSIHLLRLRDLPRE